MYTAYSLNRMASASTKKQTGATLFIGLILLVAISLVSLAAMRTSVLDLTIANNKQQLANTFEAAELTINSRLSNPALVVSGEENPGDQIGSTSSTKVEGTSSAGNKIDIADVNLGVYYRNFGPANGWELDAKGSAYHFQIDAEAESPGRGAHSNHRVGFYVIAP